MNINNRVQSVLDSLKPEELKGFMTHISNKDNISIEHTWLDWFSDAMHVAYKVERGTITQVKYRRGVRHNPASLIDQSIHRDNN